MQPSDNGQGGLIVSEQRVGTLSPTGVFLHENFRDNLIIDRFDPVLARMRGSKRHQLRSENSEDALTWNVFRSLRQINPSLWMPLLSTKGFNQRLAAEPSEVILELWRTISPPPALLRFQKDEGDSEIDVLIETPDFVWFIEAKYRSDIILKTTSNEMRDQILRNIDVGSYFAGTRDFYLSLLILDEKRSAEGIRKLQTYGALGYDFSSLLQHRINGITNLRGTGLLLWSDIAEALGHCSVHAEREDERVYAKRALDWLALKAIFSGKSENP
jgi:hypothetical protein